MYKILLNLNHLHYGENYNNIINNSHNQVSLLQFYIEKNLVGPISNVGTQ